jgi:hypothetical protein
LSAPLRQLWNGNSGIAREAEKALEREVVAEIWIPFSSRPLQFVRVSSSNAPYEIRKAPNASYPESFEVGRAYVLVLWRETLLFMILPSGSYVPFSSFAFTKNEVT